MASEKALKFPTFECVISHTQEDLDSEIEYFFIHKNHLAAQLSSLRFRDEKWAHNYEKMMLYLAELTDSLVELKSPPSHQFLIDLSMGEELEDDTVKRLLSSKSEAVTDLTAAAVRVNELLYWYVRNGKNPKFSSSFTPERFQGLPFLRLVLVYRSIALSKARHEASK